MANLYMQSLIARVNFLVCCALYLIFAQFFKCDANVTMIFCSF